MRLAQLARKLSIRTTTIVGFLAEQNIPIEDSSNVRLEDEHVNLIMQKFAPAMAAEVAAELAEEKEKSNDEHSVREEVIVEVPAIQLNILEEAKAEEPSEEKIELIKAPKVELSGLKVLGKIELPEPKKKEAPVADQIQGDQLVKEATATAKVDKPRLANRRPVENQKEAAQRMPKNPIALKREQEAQEAMKKKREFAQREKEKRTQHYLGKVKTVAPIKSARIVNEEVEELKPLAPVPKTLWGKFLRWLNT
jgi:hypothetical protein